MSRGLTALLIALALLLAGFGVMVAKPGHRIEALRDVVEGK